MPDKVVNIDGNLTMDQTRDRCVVEQNKGFRLTGIQNATLSQGGAALLVNKSEYVRDLDFPATLLFVELGANNPDKLKKQKEDEDFTHLCTGSIFVQNNIKSVMVFGK